MTISDCIAQLVIHMKALGSSAQVMIGSTNNSTENAYKYFRIHKTETGVCLVPTDVWDRKSLSELAKREQQ